MATVGVLTDTTASIPPKLADQLGIELVPYYVIRGGETLRDMVDVEPDSFARYLIETDTLPTTSNPSPGDYYNGLKRLADRTRDILALTMTSRGSGAYQSCRAAIELIVERFPKLKIELMDTRLVAMSQGWVAIEAARAALQGMSLYEVLNNAREVASRATMIQTADTLRYLYLGGRIGRAQHLVGSVLNIKPLIGMEDGVIVGLGTAHTRSRAYARMVEIMKQHLEASNTVSSGGQAMKSGITRIKAAFTHVGAREKLDVLKEHVTSAFECVEILTSQLSPALAVHSGPGTVGVSYYPVD
jgi:DegV family protein with EDD domain